jgi:hypothetical protein
VVNHSTVPPLTNDATSTSAFDIVEGTSLDLALARTADASITTTPLPRNAVVKDGIFSFTPDYSQAGLYSITFTISSGETVITRTIGIRVLNVIHIAAPPLTEASEDDKTPDLNSASDDPILPS